MIIFTTKYWHPADELFRCQSLQNQRLQPRWFFLEKRWNNSKVSDAISRFSLLPIIEKYKPLKTSQELIFFCRKFSADFFKMAFLFFCSNTRLNLPTQGSSNISCYNCWILNTENKTFPQLKRIMLLQTLQKSTWMIKNTTKRWELLKRWSYMKKELPDFYQWRGKLNARLN